MKRKKGKIKMLTLGSLFDGIGGWCLAAQRSGIKPIWSSEIEKFPMAVTAHHFPDVKQLGDITLLDGATLPPVDIICAGSPCQDLSTANSARKGLKGERSGLFKNAIDIVHRMRNATDGRFPRWFVWENVCGAFSTNSGADYRAVLQEITKASIPMPENNKWAYTGMVQCNECEVAWRVLDASGWGLPQIRKRIFLVASFGAFRAKEVLLIPQGLYGDNKEVCCSWEKPASTAEKSTRTAGRVINEGGNLAVKIRSGKGEGKAGKGALIGIEKSFTVGAVQDITLFQDVSTVRAADIKCECLTPHFSQGERIYSQSGIYPTLRSGSDAGGKGYPNAYILAEAYAIGNGQAEQTKMTDKVGTLNCMHDQIAVMQKMTSWDGKNIVSTLTASNAGGSQRMPDKNNFNAVTDGYIVRRLTPIETERLQGLPDNWTLLDSKLCSNSARYRAVGNGMAQPCADFVLKRIAEIEREDKNE